MRYEENTNEDDSNLLDTSAPMGPAPSWMEEMWKDDEEEYSLSTPFDDVENAIEQSPNPVKTAQEITGEKSNPLVTEAKQLTDNNPHNDEINNDALSRIKSEFDNYMKTYNNDQYAGNDKELRAKLGQYYTPPELTYKMLNNYRKPDMSDEDFENMLQNDTLMDPTAGSGNLLAGGISYGWNPLNVYANEPDDNVRNKILIPRLTGLGVPRNHIFPSSKHIAKYGSMSDTDEQKENKFREWVNNGWIEDTKSNKNTFMKMYGAGNALNSNYWEDMQNPETWDDLVEEAIEENPKEAAEILPENSDIQKEAEQAIDGGKDAEVRNDVVEEAIGNGEIDDDFFKAFAATMDPTPQEESDTLKENTQVYGTPSIRRASISDFRNGVIDKETYRKQLLDQLYDSREALNKSSDMMNEAREANFINGRGYVGAYSLPAGNAYTRARKELAALDVLSDEQLKDKKLVAAVKSIKNTKKMSDEELRNEMSKIVSSQIKPEEVIAQSVIPDATPEELIEAPIDYIADEIDWVSEQPTTKDGSIDWDKVKVYKPGEEPYYKVSDESWKDNPDYEPSEGSPHIKDEDFLGPDEYIDENGNIQVDINWKPENADEDFLGPDEYVDENGNIQTKPEDNEIEEAIASEVDEDETIPEEEKEETKRKRLAIFKWSKDVNYGRVQNAKLEASRKELSNAGIKYGKAYNNRSSILGNIGAITLSPISTEHKKEPVTELPRSTASYGTSKPTDEISHKAVSMKNSSGGYNNEGAFTRKAGLLGGKHSKGTITLGKGIPTSKPSSGKAASGKQQAPKVDMNVLVLKDLIIKKAVNWPEHRLETNGYLIVVREDGRVFINRQLFENFIKQNSSKLNELRRIVMEN